MDADEQPARAGLGVSWLPLQDRGMDAALRTAGWAHDLGYDSFWTGETTGPEAMTVLGAIGARFPTLGLGFGVLPIPLRSPVLAAMGAATLQAMAPARDVYLGVGISTRAVVTDWHGVAGIDRPLARTREFLTVVRQILTGEPVTFAGEFTQLTRSRLAVPLGDRRPRLVLAALNGAMIELGGELADAVVLHHLPAHRIPWVLDRVRAGEARSGNRCRVFAHVHACVTEPTAAAQHAARRDIFFYAHAEPYEKAFRAAGFGAEMDRLHDATISGDHDRARAAVSAEMLAALNPIGDADAIRRSVQAYVDAGVDLVILTPMPWAPDPMAGVRATMEAVAG